MYTTSLSKPSNDIKFLIVKYPTIQQAVISANTIHVQAPTNCSSIYNEL